MLIRFLFIALALACPLTATKADEFIDHAGGSSAPMSHDINDLIEVVDSVYGPSTAGGIQAGIQSGDITERELHFPYDMLGASDFDTIMVNTHAKNGEVLLSLFEAAMVLAHEYEHLTAAVAAGTTLDPGGAEPCGWAHEMELYKNQMALLLEVCTWGVGITVSQEDLCNQLRNAEAAYHNAYNKQLDQYPEAFCPGFATTANEFQQLYGAYDVCGG